MLSLIGTGACSKHKANIKISCTTWWNKKKEGPLIRKKSSLMEHYSCTSQSSLFIPNPWQNHSIAGTETTAGFLSGLFNLLLLPENKHILDRLVDEIRNAFETDDDIKFEELVKLPYMTAVIEEGLRMFPSAPIGFVRTVPQDGDTVDGHFIPGGVSIHFSCLLF